MLLLSEISCDIIQIVIMWIFMNFRICNVIITAYQMITIENLIKMTGMGIWTLGSPYSMLNLI